MTIHTKTPESLPEVHPPGQHGSPPPSPEKPKKRGLIWVALLLIIGGVAGYAVWRAGQPGRGDTRDLRCHVGAQHHHAVAVGVHDAKALIGARGAHRV